MCEPEIYASEPSTCGEGRRDSDAACAACAEPAEVSLPK